MRRDDIDQAELERIAVRAVQNLYPNEHQALENWGRWSRDRRGIFPAGITAPTIYDEAPQSKWGDFGEEKEYDAADRYEVNIVVHKGERPDAEEYNEKDAVALDERLHGYGGLNEAMRSVLEVAYVSLTVPEDQFHRRCSPPTTPETYRERLEDALIFVGKWI